MESKGRLIKRRGLVKSKLTRTKNFVDDFEEGSDVTQIRLRSERMPIIWQEYDDIQLQLELEDEEDHEADREEFENTYYAVLGKMTHILERVSLASATQSQASMSRHSSDRINQRDVRLPPIKLPNFSGCVTGFKHFYDTFNSLVIENDTVDDIQRYHYLLSALTGEAHRLIENLPITAENFNVAWEIICKRYHNPKLIATTHIKALFSMSSMKWESVTELRKLLNQFISNYNALTALQLETPLHEILLSQLLLERINEHTYKEWEVKANSQQFPRLEELIAFLESRCQALELVKSNQPPKESSSNGKQREPFKRAQNLSQSYVTTSHQCPVCNQSHSIYKCPSFVQKDIPQRREFVKSKGLCFNCLQSRHRVNECKSGDCHFCKKKHHTLLHIESKKQFDISQKQGTNSQQAGGSSTEASEDDTKSSYTNTMTYCSLKDQPQPQVLLSTALVQIRGNDGILHTCRALLDSCSQAHFITEALAQRLKLKKVRSFIPIQGINGLKSSVKYSLKVQMHSRVSQYHTQLECLVLPNIAGQIPSSYINTREWGIPKELALADPDFNIPGQIDMLIGAEVFFSILKPGKQVRPGPYPILQDSELGWILADRFDALPQQNVQNQPVETFMVREHSNLEEQLRKFWEIEDLNQKPTTSEEKECEEHFLMNTQRDQTGRFIVRLPFRRKPSELGESQEAAKSRLRHHERRFRKNSALQKEYIDFLNQYEELGHMKPVPNSVESVASCYLPHHPVLKHSSSTTKTRVVFDASSKTSSGTSLNDILMVGPTVQEDLHSIILRFRIHQIAFTADIEKMYRQIRVDPQDCSVQRILWRNSEDSEMKTFELQTVTYGTASASFLATRCLQQLAREEAGEYPKAAKILSRDFYVDDCISGCHSVNEALEIRGQLQRLLLKGGFQLRKWCSNSTSMINAIPSDLRGTQLPFNLDSSGCVRTLGLLWHPGTDQFQILSGHDNDSRIHNHPTRRNVLATISSIFDPLGLISPIVVLGKIFLQQTWLAKLNWDEVLPTEILQQWQHWYCKLHFINHIRIDRHVTIQDPTKEVQLHGFSDASEKAYGACFYIRSSDVKGNVTVKLLCAKSKVAPVKRISIPRLELCGALLLSRLYKKVLNALHVNISECVLWTDSTVVLSWISTSPTKWKTFVANRVSEIQENTSVCKWRHISSGENPADVISRGETGDALIHCNLWWNGPAWLVKSPLIWPSKTDLQVEKLHQEERKVKTVCLSLNHEDITLRFSSLRRLQRVVAYLLRFLFNTRCKGGQRRNGSLTIVELQEALDLCIKKVQFFEYAGEITDLLAKSSVSNKSKLKSLNPFVCKNQILRVGGRLHASQLPYEQKHQIILPPKYHLTRLIIEEEHKRLLHAGCQSVHASLRQKYWIVNGKNTIKQVIHHCLICFKFKAETAKQLMGRLPQYRVSLERPFLNTGVDCAGPILIKSGLRRSKTKVKCYITIFVCLASKAIHLEAVSDMSTQAFLAALRRFIARRGRCSVIYSDNGTNFVGAAREQRELAEAFRSIQQSSITQDFSSQEGIQWKFIPARAPHFGGIWEAGIKSMKHHLRRVMGADCLTFEELTTLLTQIEACLNSRPLISLSDDPNDPLPLTPGHFLIGVPLISLPEPDLSNTRIGLLSRWQLLQARLQHFWKSWSNDYLTQLQQRAKWSSKSSNIRPGMVVLLKEDNITPLMWKLAVIDEVHPGVDGLVRVATVRNSHGTFKRPITKLSPLPSQEEKKEH